MSYHRLVAAISLASLAACAVEHATTGTAGDELSSAHPGTLDPTFGTGGKITTDFGKQPFRANALGAQGDGKLVVAGGRDSSWTVARYLVDGSPDPSFASDLNVESFRRPYVGEVNAMAFGPNGQIVLAGDIYGGSGSEEGVLSFRRLNADGTPIAAAPHEEFLGVVQARDVHQREHLSGSGANAALVLADGGVLVAGWVVSKDQSTFARTHGFELAKFGPDGALDTAFEDKADGPLARRTPGHANALALQSDGKILVGGAMATDDVSYNSQLIVERRLADGSLDPTYGQNGRAFAPCNGGQSCGVRDLVLQPDGKLLIGAWLSRDYFDSVGAHNTTELLVIRLTADGQLDPSFGLGGFFRPNVGSWNGHFGQLALQSNGSIVLVGGVLANGADHQPLEPVDAGPSAPPGAIYYASPDSDVVLVRAKPEGVLDPSFGTGGIVYTSIGRSDTGTGASISADGKLLTVLATTITRDSVTDAWQGSMSLLRYSLHSGF